MEDQIWDGITKRLTGSETPDSKLLLDSWLNGNVNHVQKFEEIKSLWELSALIPPATSDADFNLIEEQISSATLQTEVPVKKMRFKNYAIAATVTAAVLCIAFYTYQSRSSKTIAEQWITKTADAGKMIRFLLPDSSEVWLNSGSRLSYSNTYSKNKIRSVKLTGEAYFKVRHDQSHPFVVNSGSLMTTVYGTSFSIRAYQNEHVSSVAVNSGKVGVLSTAVNDGNPFMLLPNDKLVYDRHQKSFSKSAILNRDVDSWTNGELIFEQTPLSEVFETLSRKFNIEIKVEAAKYQDCRLSARFENKSLSVILKTLQLSMNIHSTQINETIYIEGGTACNRN